MPSVLELVDGNIQLGAVASSDPQAFFKTRAGLWVSDEFERWILPKAKPANLSAVSFSSYKLKQGAHDREIIPGLPATYVFDESELCARIEQMIAKQPNGASGDLLTSGYENMFYAADRVVLVYWSVGDWSSSWYIVAWSLGDHYWGAGCRVFSRN